MLPLYLPVVEGLGKGQKVGCLSRGSQPQGLTNKATEHLSWE